MIPFLSLLVATQSMVWRPAQAPAGTPLHIRMTTAAGSFASRPGSPVEAVLIAPVKADGATILPAGCTLRGEVTAVRRVGLGLIHETSSLSLNFASITLPAGETLPVSSRLVAVDNAREAVTQDGEIREVRSTASMAHRFTRYAQRVLLWNVHAQLAVWAVKTMVMQVPEPELYLAPGVELTLVLTDPLRANVQPDPPDAPRELYEDERASLSPVIASLPLRTETRRTNRPADLINMLFVGSREELSAAFTAAGWTEARPASFGSGFMSALGVAQGRGDRSTPMSRLLLNDAPADMSWQKGFNDVTKRHHIRLWMQSQTWDGEIVWAGAATRDVDFTYLRGGMLMTHTIEERVDRERDKIAYDLAFTSCADVLDWWERPDLPLSTTNAIGDPMETDARVAVVRFNGCATPRAFVAAPEGDPLPAHGGRMQRIVRRQIISARNDLIRNNPYWKAYEGLRLVLVAIAHSRRGTPDPEAPEPRTLADRLMGDRLAGFVSMR
jgi:hypothetical protein